MRLAAIDIGSNAVRLIVKEITGEPGSLKVRKLAHTRVPIRLGEDVFGSGSIGTEKERLLGQALQGFGMLMQAMQVSEFRACATSAMRAAVNGADIVTPKNKLNEPPTEPIISGNDKIKISSWISLIIDHNPM